MGRAVRRLRLRGGRDDRADNEGTRRGDERKSGEQAFGLGFHDRETPTEGTQLG